MKINKWVRYTGVVLASWAMLCGLLWLATPVLLQSVLQEQGSEWLGRRIEVGQIDVHPWSMEVTLHDLKVAQSDGGASQFSVQRFYVNVELQSLLRFAPVIKAIHVEQPLLQLTHLGGGRYDIDDVIAKFNTPPDPSGPARFALYNVVVTGGAVQFHDHLPSNIVSTHKLTDLQMALPFLSNLQAYQTVEVTPQLSFLLNDVKFDSQSRSTPFASTPAGDLSLRIEALDLKPYLPYLPPNLPVRLDRGVLDVDMQMDFQQAAAIPRVQLKGRVTLSDVRLSEPTGAELLELGALQVEMTDVRPLERKVQLSRVQVNAPVLQVARNKTGAINWAQFGGTSESVEPTSATPAAQWQFVLAHLNIQKGILNWNDATVQPRAQLGLQVVELNVENVQWPGLSNTKVQGTMAIADKAQKQAGRAAPTRLQLDGVLSEKQASVNLDLQALDFRGLAPYVAPYLVPKLRGVLDASVQLAWQPHQFLVTLPRVSVKDAALYDGKAMLPRFKALELQDTMIDVTRKQIKVNSVLLTSPSVALERDETGQWMFARWLKPAPSASASNKKDVSEPWGVAVKQFSLRQGSVSLEDRSMAKPVNLAVTRLQAQVKNVRWLGAHAAASPMPVSVSANIQSGRTDPGRLQYQGQVSLHPALRAEGQFNLEDLPLHAVYPYLASQLRVEILRADASAKGGFQWAMLPEGMQFSLQTDALLEDVRIKNIPFMPQGSNDLNLGEELLRWKSLRVPAMTLRMAPDAATQVRIEQVIWSDFFARLVIDSSGRLNLQDVLKPAVAEPAPEPSQIATAGTVIPTPEPEIYLGSVRLERGTVRFSDRFIQPNYSADLSDLNGTLSELSSLRSDGKVGLAQLAITGKAEGTAQLQIVGQLNPLVQPITMDIEGKIDDLELSPLSAYSAKYAGYGIERGKLNINVSYNIQPDGALKASNQIVLNQLTFGDKVQNSSASLPVKLAVALLQDSNGVIDVNLPISGSINDPQFRIGPILLQVIGNLIKKAITAPFSLLASAFSGDSGGDDGGKIVFDPGSSDLSAEAQSVLNKLADAMQRRPGVIVTVDGQASSVDEQDALRRVQLHKMMLGYQLRRSKVTIAEPQPVSDWSAEQYATVLKAVYRRTDMVKPRNLVGMLKDVSVAEMEQLMLAQIQITDNMVRDLALARSMAVKEYLLLKQVPAQRVFLGAAKVVKAEQDWRPYAEMGISLP